MTPSQVLDETAAAIISAVHGRDEVVVVAAEEFRRLKGERTGAALIAALQASPYRDIELNQGANGFRYAMSSCDRLAA